MRIFLSAVSGQFKDCRDALASDLRAVGAEVVVQEDFQQQGRTLLEKLEGYIASCDRVIALIGDAYGWEPDPLAMPNLPQRSYSQWEYFFAQGERLLASPRQAIDTFVYFASSTFLASHPVTQEVSAAQRQKDFVAHVLRSGKDRSEFSSVNELRVFVLRDGFRLPPGDYIRTAAALRLVPRPPLVGFIPRHDKQGRDILERLRRELNPSKNQLVALWGPGGVGKTALAAQATRSWGEEFGSKIVWVATDQSANFTLDALLDLIASHLGKPELVQASYEVKKNKVSELLAEAPSLVVLDSFEIVLPENQEPCVSWLAEKASCTALLITRDSLSFKRDGVDLALNIVVEAMATDEAREFVERYAALEAADALSGVDPDKIIQASDGNPLLMQWVIAQIGLAQSAAAVFEQLAHGKGGAVQRVFDRSFNLPQLGDDGRAVLLALSLFVPNALRKDVAEAAGFAERVEQLNAAVRNLVALRLLNTMDGGESLALRGLTRELAKDRLTHSSQVDDFRRRFVAAFLRYLPPKGGLTREDRNALKKQGGNLLGAMEVAVGMEDWGGVATLAANAVGTLVESFFRIDGAGSKRPVTETEYQSIGRAALVSFLEVSDNRRIPLENDALWKKMTDSGNPITIAQLLRLDGVSCLPMTCYADYCCIVFWAEAMKRLSTLVVELLSLKDRKDIKKEMSTDQNLGSFRYLSGAVKDVIKTTNPQFDEPWDLIVMAQASRGQDNARAGSS